MALTSGHAACANGLQGVSRQEMRLSETESISQQDLQDIWDWNAFVPATVESCVHDLITETMRKQPDAPAVCAWDGEWTYTELDDVSNRLAHHLVMSLGVGIETVVPLCFEKSRWMPVAMLAVMKAGGASVAVDTTQPEERLRTIMRQIQPQIILSSSTNQELAGRLADRSTVVTVDETHVSQLNESCERDLPKVQPRNMLYVAFTSGSTGTPKGAVISHANFSSAIKHQEAAHEFSPESRVYDFVSYAFDVAWSNALRTLTCGGCLCIPSETDRRDDLAGSIRRLRANVAQLTPSTASLLPPETIQSLKLLIVGGESLPPEEGKRWAEMVKVKNAYGPCECTPPVALVDVDSKSAHMGIIGKGIGLNTWVVRPSDHNYLAVVGDVGELLLEGPIVGDGYFGDPEKTAAVFVHDPPWLLCGAKGRPGRSGRLYKTGDLVRYNSDGSLSFIGRKDAQVKINGQRVELSDVEYHVSKNLACDVKMQVVAEVVTPFESDKAVLAVFLHMTAASEDAVWEVLARLTAGLNEKLAAVLPSYMIPTAYVPIDDIPMTGTGKTDRRRLRAVGEGMTLKQLNRLDAPGGQHKQPITAMERRLQSLWSTVLGIEGDSIGRDDSFLRIGGDSIEAMKLVATARKQGLSLSIADVFKQPRLSDLARALSDLSVDEASIIEPFSLVQLNTDIQTLRIRVAGHCGVDTDQIEDVFPCTPLQEGLLALTAKRSGDYVARRVLQLREAVDLSRFRQAWEEVVRTAPILRTRIIDLGVQGLVQVVVNEGAHWEESLDGLDAYIEQDKKAAMGLGTPLSRLGLVEESATDDTKRFLVWTMHHATYDGWSMPILIERLETAYRRELPIQQGISFQGFVKHVIDVGEEQADRYWASQFSGLEAVVFPALPSPAYQPRTTMSATRHVQNLQWPTTDVTPSTVIRAALSAVIAGCTDSQDVVFGVLLTGRQAALPGVEQVVGPTITTVPVRVVVDHEKTVEELHAQVQSQSVEMTTYEQTGLQRIRHISAESQQACGFQTLLVIQPVAPKSDRWGELFVETEVQENEDGADGLAKFHTYAMTVKCTLEAQGLRVWIGFDSGIIDSHLVGRLLGQLEHILRQMCDPNNALTRLGDVDTVTEQDLQDIWEWNVEVPETAEVCVHNLITAVAQKQPAAPAVCAWDGDWTYDELDRLSSRLAHHLVELGVGPGVIVPLCFEKSKWTPVVMLAVMKAGGASVAMDTSQPEQRLRAIVHQVEPVLLILSSSANQELAGRLTNRPTLVADEAFLTQLGTAGVIPLPIVKPHDILYVTFTSGSTGTPKGAIITHANFSSAIKHQQVARGFEPTSRVYDFASYAFDVAWSNVLNSLTCGGCLCIPSEADRRNDLAGSIRRLKATFASLTPSTASVLPIAALKSLKQVVLGGESIVIEDAKQWASTTTVRNGYGPCECTPTATIGIINAQETKAASIGKGFGLNTWITRPSDHNYLTAVGSVGELLLEGPLVGAGYIGDPEITAAAFVEDPPWLLRGTATGPGRRGRLYKTGDLVRYNVDGSLVFVGRKDAQVKIRGQRVELGDVEHHVRLGVVGADEADIQVVAEVMTPLESDKAILVAFIQHGEITATATGENALRAEVERITTGLDERLAVQLPAYMIPSAYIPVANIPVTATGKIDRRRLRMIGEKKTLEQLTALHAARGQRREPRTAMEHRMQSLWSAVLRVEAGTIGADDSFLRIGGDSIAAMKLVGLARDQGLSLTVADIFKQPRLSDLATVAAEYPDTQITAVGPFELLDSDADLSEMRRRVVDLCEVDAAKIEDVFPCTPLQEGLLALTAKRAGDYVAQQVLELQADIQTDRLQRAWEQVVKITPILRTRIVDLGQCQGLVQVVVAEGSEDWQSSLDSLEKYIQQDKDTVMGLGTPLVRFQIIQEPAGDGRRFLVWTMHHAIYDGWSMPILIDRLEKAYRGEVMESQHSPPFQEFVRHIIDIDRSEEARFWETQFDGLEAEAFPALPSSTYHPRTDTLATRHIGGLQWPNTDVTTSTVVRAAWSVAIAEYTDSDDVVFGVTLTGRQAAVAGVDRMVGPTIATVPVRVVVDREKTVEQLQAQVQSQSTEMTRYEQTGLQVIRRLGPESQRACDFQTLLVIQPAVEDSNNNKQRELFVKQSPDANGGRFEFHTYAITIECKLEEQGLHVRVKYDSHVIDNQQIDKLMAQFESILQLMCSAESAQKRLAEVDTISRQDLGEVWDWNRDVPETTHACVHDLIANVVQKQPDALAVCAWDGDWTYRELNDAATRFAHQLVSLGVGPEVIVPLCFEKSRWTSVAMLAVMKAGGASVAMDTTQPEERLRTIIRQIRPSLILTSSSNQALAGRLTDAPAVVLDEYHLAQLNEPITRQHLLLPAVQPWNKLYVVFTSGSTGTPKGAIVTHSNFSSAIAHQQAAHGFKATSRLYDFASYAFDVAWSNVLHMLACGGCLCVPSENDRRNDLAGSMHRLRANFGYFTPTVANLLPSRYIHGLETLVLGGEKLALADARRWAGMVSVRNVYGPCECTPATTIAHISQANTHNTTSIGKGIGVNTWVVRPSNYNYLVAIGGVGELLMEGPLIGTGYLGDEERTAASFVDDPSWLLRGGPGGPGRRGRLYKTGDLVRYNADGSLEFIGRKDAQVKINGQRVELGDVEHHVRMGITDSTDIQVIAEVITPCDSNKAVLVAFLHLEPTIPIGERQAEINRITTGLDERLATQLPAHMIPTAYIPVDSIPMMAAGKIDRRRLRAVGEAMKMEELIALNAPSNERRQPATPMEKRLQSLWALVLGIKSDAIGADDSFLRIGGDSIRAMKLVGAARDQDLLLTVADIFSHPRLGDLATVVTERPAIESGIVAPFSLLKTTVNLSTIHEHVAALCDVDAAMIEDVFPCTPLQEGLLALTAKRAGDYVARQAFELRPMVDTDRFRRAWEEVVRTAPILRTRILDLAGQGLVQVIINQQVRWTSAADSVRSRSTYERADRELSTGLGTPLARYGLVEDAKHDGRRFFMWTAHHAIYDGWSVSIILDRLERTYKDAGKLPLPPSIQGFVKHIMSVDERLMLEYWKAQFRGLEAQAFPALTTPTCQPRTDTSVTRYIEGLQWPQTDITASTAVRTAWSLVAAGYTDSDDVIFGVTSTGRQAALSGVDQMLGPTIATVPVRVVLGREKSVEELQQQVQAQATEMTAFEQTGLQQIRRVSAESQQACGFQTLLVIQPPAASSDKQSELFIRERHRTDENDHHGRFEFYTYALTIECKLEENGLRLRLGFDSNVVNNLQVEKILSQFEYILRLTCEAKNGLRKLGDIETVSQQDLGDIWNWNSDVPETVESCVHDLITKTVQKQPESPAVCAWDGDWTYRELDEASTRLAHLLVRSGVGPQVVVPLFFEKSKWTPVAMLAVMKAGGASAVMDVTQPEERLRTIVEQVKPVLILSSSPNRELVGRIASRVAVIIVDEAQLNDLGDPNSELHEEQLATVMPSSKLYVVFTSGSTGVPKGVIITHANFSSAIKHQQAAHGFNTTSRFFDFVSYAFDIAWSNVLHALTCGGCLCIPSEADRRDDPAGAIYRLQANVAQLTPSTASLLPLSTVKSLRILILGGENLPLEDARKWAEVVTVKNAYGPCECTPATTVTDVHHDSAEAGSIGTAIGTNSWVVRPSDHNYLVAIGSVGELVLEGPLVGSGYFGDAERLNDTAFIEDPRWLLRGAPGRPGRHGRLYKTGDLVRYNANGSLIFIGRKDAQVKISGQRVELDEIQSHISRHPSTRQAISLFPESGPCAKKLVGIFSLKSLQRGSNEQSVIQLVAKEDASHVEQHIETLQALLGDALPSYMTPSVWVALRDLPLNSSGKMNRKQLQGWLCGIDSETYNTICRRSNHSSAPHEPTTDAERSLRDACSLILGVPVASVDLCRSFVANGGDSITAMRLSSYCRSIGIVFSVSSLLKSKSLVEFSQTLATTVSSLIFRTESFGNNFNLSPIQQWYLSHLCANQANIKGHYFNQGVYLSVNPQVSSAEVSRMILEIVKCHSMLRARFQRFGSDWVQRVLEPVDGLHHFQSSSAESLSEVAFQTQQRHQQLDIESGPVFAVDLYTLLTGEQYLILIAHHLVVDVVSWRIILDDLQTLLAGGALQPSGLPFQVWNEMQTAKAKTRELEPDSVLPAGEEIKQSLEFWNFGQTTPNTFCDLVKRSTEVQEHTTSLLLKDANNAFGTEPVELILAAISDAFLQVFPERDGLTVFSEGHGREPWSEEIDLTRTVGWFTTMSPIHISRSKANSQASLVRAVKDARRRLPANGWAYFTSRYLNDKGIEAFKPHESTMEVAFNYHGQLQQQKDSLLSTVKLDGVSAVGPDLPSPALFSINASITSGLMHLSLSWNRHIAHQGRIHEWIDQVGPSLQAICDHLASRKTSETTLCDYQFLALDYERLEELQSRVIPRIESTNESVVEDIYPCSSMVDGMLLSQIQEPGSYKTSHTYEIKVRDSATVVNIDRLAEAWQMVVARHSSLRTVFIDGIDADTAFSQAVLAASRAEVILLQSDSEALALALLKELPPVDYQQPKPPHRLTLCQISDSHRVFCRLEMSHVITDGGSTAIIQTDWAKAYAGKLDVTSLRHTSRDFAQALKAISREDKMKFWMQKLAGVAPCYFPDLPDTLDLNVETCKVSFDIANETLTEIQQFCEEQSVTPASLFQSAWALTLAAYTGTDSVCFGYLASGRDMPVKGITESIGTYANMLIYRGEISREWTSQQYVRYTYDQVVRDMGFQYCSLADIQHELDVPPGQGLFNTIFSFQTGGDAKEASQELLFRSFGAEDPTTVSAPS